MLKLDVGDRILLCKFRCGNNKLPVTKCRYLADQPLELCSLCNITI